MGGEGDVVAAVRAERGYIFSHHVIYGRLEPGLLQAHFDFYRAFTIAPRFLSARQRELVWIGLLAVIEEAIGSLHLERAAAAGLSAAEMAAAVALGGVAGAWRALHFGTSRWQRFIEADAETLYAPLVDTARGPLEPELADLILLVVHGVRRDELPFVYHLNRLLTGGMPETHVAEAISYLLVPVGANTLIWATDTWLQALRDGGLPESPTFGRGEVVTRTD